MDRQPPLNSNQITQRRKVIRTLLGAAMATPVLSLIGCGGASTSTASTSASAATSTGSTGSSGGTTSGSGTTSSGVTTTTDWLSGGTSSMTENFPDDSLFESSSTCSVELTQTLTEGPCYFDSEYRDDISEGQTGLPMMLCLQLVDANCNPLSGYEIEVWHCDVDGIYSGDTSDSSDANGFSSSFCTGNDRDALAAKWFRGIKVTDSAGRVNFSSCFPGWYSSRVIHIHFRVKSNNNDEVVSQFAFSDDFVDAICTSHTDYSSRGEPDTHLSGDTVFRSSDEAFLFDLQQNADGSLLAYKRIVIS
ncbi:intradiol ring-cleavage dioxygenase [Alteromonas sp. AMM-1]|uniref:dioxygenase family protein n=1 Tax=Alteromonas sp. AMM-1 TaxID=3394233 RepID=UPI0039A4AB49